MPSFAMAEEKHSTANYDPICHNIIIIDIHILSNMGYLSYQCINIALIKSENYLVLNLFLYIALSYNKNSRDEYMIAKQGMIHKH